jgi:hypothetical protein
MDCGKKEQQTITPCGRTTSQNQHAIIKQAADCCSILDQVPTVATLPQLNLVQQNCAGDKKLLFPNTLQCHTRRLISKGEKVTRVRSSLSLGKRY